MAKLHIASDLELPAEAVTQTFAILAKRGVGKTYTASVMTEEMLKAGLQVVVADPIGVWWGLRASADGKREGLPIVVLGGDHGDVPLEETAGKVIADLIVDERISAVLDLSHLRKGAQLRFMTEFAEVLYHRNREPLHLMLDEADAFAPQRPQRGHERLLGAIEDLVRRGRARGLGVTLVTQRPAVLNKNVLTQTEVLVALRTVAPQDRAAIDEWVKVYGEPGQREEVMGSLASLDIGETWWWSPGWLDLFKRARVRKRGTFDSSATPKGGQTRREPRTLADVDVEQLQARMADTIERAKAEDPKELRRRIAQLEKDLRERPAPEPERIEVPVLEPAHREELRELVGDFRQAAEQLLEVGQVLDGRLAKLDGHAVVAISRPQVRQENPNREPDLMRERSGSDPSSSMARDLGKGPRTILEALVRQQPTLLTRAQAGTLSGYSASGGSFQKYVSTLRREGLIDIEGTYLVVTEAGLERLGGAPPPQSPEDVLETWRGSLGKGPRALLDALLDAYPDGLTREELGQQAGYESSGGSFQKYLSTLKRNNLADVEAGSVRASDALFLSG